MTIISLTTDFGLADGYVGIMKGVILGLAPDVHLVDLSHDIAPQNVRQAALLLSRACPYFPAGAVHLAVVDPGVGGARLPLVVTTERATFVGPDNGLFTAALDQPGAQAWALDRPEFWLSTVSHTFHGRDIFAPVAAHLARGIAPAQMGQALADPVRLSARLPQKERNGRLLGSVIHVDRFGNLMTDIPAAWVTEKHWACCIASQRIEGLRESYAAVARGELLMLISSDGTVEISVREGSAAERLGLGVGTPIELQPM